MACSSDSGHCQSFVLNKPSSNLIF
uniref:Uncharacterized protein n=1 Tax=Arundo donax TaxID=35708 RepID=A0A0A9B037_ARUDO